MTTYQIQVSRNDEVLFRTEAEHRVDRVAANVVTLRAVLPTDTIHVIKSSTRTDVLSMTDSAFVSQYVGGQHD